MEMPARTTSSGGSVQSRRVEVRVVVGIQCQTRQAASAGGLGIAAQQPSVLVANLACARVMGGPHKRGRGAYGSRRCIRGTWGSGTCTGALNDAKL